MVLFLLFLVSVAILFWVTDSYHSLEVNISLSLYPIHHSLYTYICVCMYNLLCSTIIFLEGELKWRVARAWNGMENGEGKKERIIYD